MSLVGISDVLTYIELSSGVANTLIQLLIVDYSKQVNEFCGRDFEQRNYNEKFDIEGATEKTIRLNNTPVTSVVALTDNGSLIAASDYHVYARGKITLDSDYFTEGPQEVEASYVAGFTPVPADIQLAVSRLIEEDYYGRKARHKGFQAEKIVEYSYRLPDMQRFKDTKGYPPDVYATLMNYKIVTGGDFGQ